MATRMCLLYLTPKEIIMLKENVPAILVQHDVTGANAVKRRNILLNRPIVPIPCVAERLGVSYSFYP